MDISLCRDYSHIHCLPLCLTPAHPILYLTLNPRPLLTNQKPKEAALSNEAVKSLANPLSCDKSLIFKEWTDPLGAARSGRSSVHRPAPLYHPPHRSQLTPRWTRVFFWICNSQILPDPGEATGHAPKSRSFPTPSIVALFPPTHSQPTTVFLASLWIIFCCPSLLLSYWP